MERLIHHITVSNNIIIISSIQCVKSSKIKLKIIQLYKKVP